MKKNILFFVLYLCCVSKVYANFVQTDPTKHCTFTKAQKSSAWKEPTTKGYIYKNEIELPIKNKILVFSYGSLVKQKENRKTGDVLQAGTFIKTEIKVPVSFTFLAGYPKYGHLLPLEKLEQFPTRRATVTIDNSSLEYKNIWSTCSKFTSLDNARNNLAAREGAPYQGSTKGYDLTHIFYIKKLSPFTRKQNYEQRIDGFPDWVILKNDHNQQEIPNHLIKEFVNYSIKNGANAVIWAALPSNIDIPYLDTLIEQDNLFVKNSQRYIASLPPGNTLTEFEKKIMQKIRSFNENE